MKKNIEFFLHTFETGGGGEKGGEERRGFCRFLFRIGPNSAAISISKVVPIGLSALAT